MDFLQKFSHPLIHTHSFLYLIFYLTASRVVKLTGIVFYFKHTFQFLLLLKKIITIFFFSSSFFIYYYHYYYSINIISIFIILILLFFIYNYYFLLLLLLLYIFLCLTLNLVMNIRPIVRRWFAHLWDSVQSVGLGSS